MILILLVMAGIMNGSRRLMLKIIAEAELYAGETAVQAGLSAADLIRLCQFIKLWIPGK